MRARTPQYNAPSRRRGVLGVEEGSHGAGGAAIGEAGVDEGGHGRRRSGVPMLPQLHHPRLDAALPDALPHCRDEVGVEEPRVPLVVGVVVFDVGPEKEGLRLGTPVSAMEEAAAREHEAAQALEGRCVDAHDPVGEATGCDGVRVGGVEPLC